MRTVPPQMAIIIWHQTKFGNDRDRKEQKLVVLLDLLIASISEQYR